MNADSSDPNLIPSASSHGSQDARVYIQENLSGTGEDELVLYEKADDDAYKVERREARSSKIISDFSTNECFDHNGSEVEKEEAVKAESQNVYTIHNVIVVDKSDEMKIENGGLFEKNCVPESAPEVEEIAVVAKVPEDKGEKPLSVKERMKFYREKEVESGASVRYGRGFSTSKSQTITAGRAEIGVTKEILFEDRRKHSEEMSSGVAKEDIKTYTGSISEKLDRKEEEKGEVVEFLEETEEILLNKSVDKEDEQMGICPIRGTLKQSPEADTCEYNEKEVKRKSDPGLSDEEKEDQRLNEKVILDVSREVSSNHMLIDNHQHSEKVVDLFEEDQTSNSVCSHVLFKEDLPIVKMDICEEEHEVSNEVNENLSVTEKEHVEDVIANEESKAAGLSMIYCFYVVKTFSLGLSNVAFINGCEICL